jgi:hypothetical protein
MLKQNHNLFCSLFNVAVSIQDSTTANGKMMMNDELKINWKERPWFNQGIILALPEGFEEND